MTANRVKTTTTTTGTGNITVSATPAARCRPLSDISVNAIRTIVIEDEAGTDWEMSRCTVLSATTFSRDTVLIGSNGTSKVSFGAGTKVVKATISDEEFSDFLSSADGITLDQYLTANPGSSVTGTDVLPVTQGGALKGVTAAVIGAYVLSLLVGARKLSALVTSTAAVPLDFTTHNRRNVVCTVAANLTGPTAYGSVGDDFECNVSNRSSGVVTFGAGITCLPSGNTLGAGQEARVYSQGGTIYVHLPVAGTPAVAPVAPGQVTNLTAGTPTSTTVPLTWTAASGTVTGNTLEKSVNGGTTWTQVATGITGTSTTASSLASATPHQFRVTAYNGSTSGTPSAITSATTAAAASAVTVTASARSGFPINKQTYSSGFYSHDFTISGATITSAEFALTESATVYPASTISGSTTPRGDVGAAEFYQSNYWLSQNLGLSFSVATSTPFYFWIKITDSLGGVHYFRRTDPINWADSMTATSTSAASSTPAFVP